VSRSRRLAIALLVVAAAAFGAAAVDQPAPSAAESVLGAPTP
jgi:hypothetical protein